jgi:hypothetical protein
MKRNVSLKYLALGVAAGLLGFAGSAFAQSADQNYQLVGVNARLDRAISSDTVKVGDAVEAKLDATVKTSDGVKLEKGTELLGTVADVAPSAHHSAASLTLLFSQAQLKDGKKIPVKVTLLAAYSASENGNATYGDSLVAPPPQHVDPQQVVVQEPGLLSRVELKSAVKEQDSGTFSKADGNFRLDAGTYLQVAIAPNGNGTSAGE